MGRRFSSTRVCAGHPWLAAAGGQSDEELAPARLDVGGHRQPRYESGEPVHQPIRRLLGVPPGRKAGQRTQAAPPRRPRASTPSRRRSAPIGMRAASSRCSSNPTTDGIHGLPGSEDRTGHHSHGFVGPMPDQLKRRPQVRNDNSHLGLTAVTSDLDKPPARVQGCGGTLSRMQRRGASPGMHAEAASIQGRCALRRRCSGRRSRRSLRDSHQKPC